MRGDRPSASFSSVFIEWFTPHARGSTVIADLCTIVPTVYPACAGIDHDDDRESGCRYRLPRMRGDRPCFILVHHSRTWFTPHARGSTPRESFHHEPAPVYPACAGIDPPARRYHLGSLCLPRMRGDRPYMYPSSVKRITFTPHARGSTVKPDLRELPGPVYPACAGIDRI